MNLRYKYLLAIVVFIINNGCASNNVAHRETDEAPTFIKTEPYPLVSMQYKNTKPLTNLLFKVACFESTDPTLHHIVRLISKKLRDRGYHEANSKEEATIAIWYSFDIRQPTKNRSGVILGFGYKRDVWGYCDNRLDNPDNVFPTFFNIQATSLVNSRFPNYVDYIWRGGANKQYPDLSILNASTEFINLIFDKYDMPNTAIKNKRRTYLRILKGKNE